MHGTALMLLALCSQIEPEQTDAPRVVTVSAQSEVWVKPDVAVLSIAVANSDLKLSVAKQANEDLARAIAKVIESHRLNAGEYKLTDLTMGPRLSNRVVVGYTVSRSLDFRLKDFSKVDPLVADLVEACGDSLQIDSLQYQVADQRRHQVEARRLAVLYAREKASHLAALNGMSLGQVRAIHEGVEYDADSTGFGGFGGMGVGIEHGLEPLVAAKNHRPATPLAALRFVSDAEPSSTESDDPQREAAPAQEVRKAGVPNVEQQLLTAVGQVNLNAAVTIEWELIPGEK